MVLGRDIGLEKIEYFSEQGLRYLCQFILEQACFGKILTRIGRITIKLTILSNTQLTYLHYIY